MSGNTPGATCIRCSKIHDRCSAHNRAGQPCGLAPAPGQRVCRLHGGAAPGAIAKAARRAQEAAIAGQVAALLAEVQVDDLHPLDGLLDIVTRTGNMTRALGLLVSGLDLHPEYAKDADTGVVRLINEPMYGPDHQGDGKPHILVDMYGVWTDRHTRACKLALDAGIDERRLRLAENDVEQLFAAFTRALNTVGLTPDQTRQLQTALATELRAIDEPAALVR